MAIRKLEDDRYQVDVVRPNGTRARRIFDKRRDAVAFEAQIRKEKYEAKLVRTGLKKERYLMEQAITDFETSKKSLRASSIKRYRSILHQLRIFCDACGSHLRR
ncbi:MAG: hypothetical protein IPP94_16680 [Ignavibacteria bacterium]|nr:hypothetical protein [Ignavibacteria bacterium]